VIGQVQKPMEEILEMLDGKEKLVLYGCGDALRVDFSFTHGQSPWNSPCGLLQEGTDE